MSRRSGRSRIYNDTGNLPEDYHDHERDMNQLDDEELEITRCICGLDELNPISANSTLKENLFREYKIKIDLGLFIQCDKCLVWQHGYCVGLFIDDDVPDKYWCEMCKPDLHVLLYDGGDVVRSLYKPANESRERLLLQDLAAGQSFTSFPRPTRPRGGKRLSNNQQPASQDKGTVGSSDLSKPNSRKERRHYEDSYDEQLKKALRLSATESGIPMSETESLKAASGALSSSNSDENNATITQSLLSGEDVDVKGEKSLEFARESASGLESESTNFEKSSSRSKSEHGKRPTLRTGQVGRPKRPRSNNTTSGAALKMNQDLPQGPLFSRDELINQPSKTRYVSGRLSMYELRKRTGAILEWLGQRQLEYEEDRTARLATFNTVEQDIDTNVKEEISFIEKTSNENLQLVASLTERILSWEEKYGSYAA